MLKPVHRLLTAVTAVTLISTAATSASLTAAAAAETDTTFTLEGEGLSITAPASAELGTVAVGAATLSGSLGPVAVTDRRGMLAAVWTATVHASDFTTGGGTAAETVAATRIMYTPGLPSASSPATGVFTPTPGLLGLPLPVYTGAATGNNTVTWNPTVEITLPAAAVAGTYTGTITHSVS